jgi:hypothetical protein
MAQRLNLTRDQLAKFLGTHEEIRQFERLFGQSNDNAETIETLDARVDLLENPPGITIVANHQADTDAYWIVAEVTGLTVTLPKCSAELLGKTWDVSLAAVGDVTIETAAGDTVPTPANPVETTVILNRRGSTVAMRCVSLTTWSFA